MLPLHLSSPPPFLGRCYTGVSGRSCETELLGRLTFPAINGWLLDLYCPFRLVFISTLASIFPMQYYIVHLARFKSRLILRSAHSFHMPLIVFIKQKLAR
ncbi:hypothetical protein BDV38DRAFT_229650 [Aspergillus pseudotamarii]|uniref:Uncharacterized protein n=1 Tax=Aspergillus pseudotamarii TaxID=132259 RepID=A0A5N6SFC9_ASPPS|nr:uncharacterized protein BDV38DRAFT_229650 [Aspergillus pseudotamarii]KAE8131814.1 hypothetical protein BDV38DRAFT_229650 [Aspergillus pseudotamarii]